jgi:hypothetical protein
MRSRPSLVGLSCASPAPSKFSNAHALGPPSLSPRDSRPDMMNLFVLLLTQDLQQRERPASPLERQAQGCCQVSERIVLDSYLLPSNAVLGLYLVLSQTMLSECHERQFSSGVVK